MKLIGIMTGNSLDAVDVVLTEFDKDVIKDLASHTIAYPISLRDKILHLRVQKFCYDDEFRQTVDEYTILVAKAVDELIKKSSYDQEEIVALGFHGQTVDHFPPSIAKGKQPYTVQIGNPQLLANLTGIPVIYDFRSDDMLNGGEGAPLAPVHNLHLTEFLGKDSVAFCNGGNTGNIAIVDHDNVVGWDTGPFNHFADMLMRKHKNLPYDKDGKYGAKGHVNQELLAKLFKEGESFYNQKPPRSSDPNHYILVYDDTLSFEDNLRTVEYFSAYLVVHSLRFAPKVPALFLLFGGGWKNPLIKKDFEDLLADKGAVVDWADSYGLSGEYMEARIFADMAYCKILNIPFSLPETTGCKTPTVGGVFVYPKQNKKYLLRELLTKHNNSCLPESNPLLWSRAAHL